MVASFTYSVAWDSAPVRQAFGDCRVVFDGVVTVASPRGKVWQYRVNVSATRGGRKPEFALRYLTAAKRGAYVPENQLASVREFLTGAAAEHLADYRAAYVAECRARDAAEYIGTHSDLEALPAETVEESAVTIGTVRTIDCTPTWAAIVPVFIMALQNGTSAGERAAIKELTRMAALADERNEFAGRLAALKPLVEGFHACKQIRAHAAEENQATKRAALAILNGESN